MTSIAEYKSQLADIDSLLEESPEDENLLKLKSDLLELIELTRDEGSGSDDEVQTSVRNVSSQIQPSELEATISSLPVESSETLFDTAKPVKILKPKKFDVPPHLLPLPSDTDAERKRKKRTLKALKAKHRTTEIEYESSKKQNAWLDFTKKKTKAKDSIFRSDGEAKVGVAIAPVVNQDKTTASNEHVAKRQRHNF